MTARASVCVSWHAPLRSPTNVVPCLNLPQAIDFNQPDPTLGVHAEDPEEAAAIVDAALRNLSRARAAVHTSEVRLEPSFRCPSLLRLLHFFIGTERIHYDMPELGADELAALMSIGRHSTRDIRELDVGMDTTTLPGFFTPTLWSALPGLRTLVFSPHAEPAEVPVQLVLECFAAAPHPVTVKWLSLGDEEEQAELVEQLAALPGGKVTLVEWDSSKYME